jgi:hypothetical protein
MIPFILATIGGYLIGDSMRVSSYKKGGQIEFKDTGVVIKLIGQGDEKEFKDLWSDKIIPKNPFYAWLYDDVNAESKIDSKEYDLAKFESSLGDFWVKDAKKYKGGQNLIALLQGRISDDGRELYILTMSTNPTYRRRGAMSYLIKKVRENFNVEIDNVYFFGLTEKGQKFYDKKRFDNGGDTKKLFTYRH